MMASHKDL